MLRGLLQRNFFKAQEYRGQRPLIEEGWRASRALPRCPAGLPELGYKGPQPGRPQPLRVSPLCCRWAAPSWPQRSPPPCHLRHPSDQQLVSAMLALTSGRAGGQARHAQAPEKPLGVRREQEGIRRSGRRWWLPAGKPLGMCRGWGKNWDEHRRSTLIIPARSRARGAGTWRLDPWSPHSSR